MTRNIKVLGLAFVAVLAMSAVVAQGAQATVQPVMTAESGLYPVQLDGTPIDEHSFTIGTKTLTCGTVAFNGEIVDATKAVTIAPTYTNCHTVVLGTTFDVTVTLNGCDFNFTLDETANTTETEYPATTKVVCPGSPIELHVYSGAVVHTEENTTCRYTIAGQTTGGTKTKFKNTNKGTKTADIDAITNGVTIAFTRVKGTQFACGGNAAGAGTATYNGETKVKGTRPALTQQAIHVN